MSFSTKKLAYAGLMTALTFIATYTIKIPVPFTEGYVHLGDSMVFLSAFLLGGWFGALAAGIGSMLADIIGGYAHWALPTLVIKTAMAAIICLALSAKSKKETAIFFSGLIAFWVVFLASVKLMLQNGIQSRAKDIVAAMKEVDTVKQLNDMARSVQLNLNIAAVVLLVVTAAIFLVIRKKEKKLDWLFFIGMIGSGLSMIAGYYLAGSIMYGNFIVPIFSIPWNFVQFAMGFVIALILSVPLKRLIKV